MILTFPPSGIFRSRLPIEAPEPMLSDGEIGLTLAPLPPSLNIAGGYSSNCFPGTLSIPERDSARFEGAPARSTVNSLSLGCPAACASSICCALSGYFDFDTATSVTLLFGLTALSELSGSSDSTFEEIASPGGLPREHRLRLQIDPDARNDVVGADPFLSLRAAMRPEGHTTNCWSLLAIAMRRRWLDFSLAWQWSLGLLRPVLGLWRWLWVKLLQNLRLPPIYPRKYGECPRR
jgi:hypothetical protein